MPTQNIKPQKKRTPALLLTLLTLSSVALCGCQTRGVVRPQAQVVLDKMPQKPQAQGKQTVLRELLTPQPQTKPR